MAITSEVARARMKNPEGPATEKQIALMVKIGLTVPDGLTKGGACDLLSANLPGRGRRVARNPLAPKSKGKKASAADPYLTKGQLAEARADMIQEVRAELMRGVKPMLKRQKVQLKKELEADLMSHGHEIMATYIATALGKVTAERLTKDGRVREVRLPPNEALLKDGVNRLIGQVAETVEVSGLPEFAESLRALVRQSRADGSIEAEVKVLPSAEDGAVERILEGTEDEADA